MCDLKTGRGASGFYKKENKTQLLDKRKICHLEKKNPSSDIWDKLKAVSGFRGGTIHDRPSLYINNLIPYPPTFILIIIYRIRPVHNNTESVRVSESRVSQVCREVF